MSGRKRPSAFDLSFGGDDSDGFEIIEKPRPPLPPSRASNTSRSEKRKETSAQNLWGMNVDTEPGPSTKRVKYTGSYKPAFGVVDIPEDTDGLFPEEANSEDPDARDEDTVPERSFSGFCLFDPFNDNEFVSLDGPGEDEEAEGFICAAGCAKPKILDDEEDEEESDEEDEDKELEGVKRVMLGQIREFYFDYLDTTKAPWIRTDAAWYELYQPSDDYKGTWDAFFQPHLVAQLILSKALHHPEWTMKDFLGYFVGRYDENLDCTFTEGDLDRSVEALKRGLEAVEVEKNKDCAIALRSTPFVNQILSAKSHSTSSRAPASPRVSRRGKPKPKAARGHAQPAADTLGGPVLTPLVARIAGPYIPGKIYVMGLPDPSLDRETLDLRAEMLQTRVRDMVANVGNVKRIYWHQDRRTKVFTGVELDGALYKIGTSILVTIGTVEGMAKKNQESTPCPSELSHDQTLADCLWAARIVRIESGGHFHVHYYEFASKSILGTEFHNPQELFLTPTCGNIVFKDVAGIIGVERCVGPPPKDLDFMKFFVRAEYRVSLGEFVTPDFAVHDFAADGQSLDSCGVCQLQVLADHENHARYIPAHGRRPARIEYRAHSFHPEDYALIRSKIGPAEIGKICSIDRDLNVEVRKLGRVQAVDPKILPAKLMRDERSLYITDEKCTFKAQDLLRVIHVIDLKTCKGEDKEAKERTADRWLTKSPYHFILRWKFPFLQIMSWNQSLPLTEDDTGGCDACHTESNEKAKKMKRFLKAQSRTLNVLDVCSGVGGLGAGFDVEGLPTALKWCVEINEDAALATKKNIPNATVFNQDLDKWSHFLLKAHQGHLVDPLYQRYDPTENIAQDSLPKPGEVDVFLAGIPCPPHSSLNMFKKANDPRTFLLFTVLSQVDFFRPQVFYFENVRGFLTFRLGAKQAGEHRLEGGIPMAGLRIMVHILLELGYQSRYALLQAMDYGAPQDRIRFILVAAPFGQLLPNIPTPSHQHPKPHSMSINPPKASKSLDAYWERLGTAPHPFTSIYDALMDLRRFDWALPSLNENSKPDKWDTAVKKSKNVQARKELGIPRIECGKTSERKTCGFDDERAQTYCHEPRTRFQLLARLLKNPRDLQHFTEVYTRQNVTRVLLVGNNPNSDYRDIPLIYRDFQTSNPTSAKGKQGFNSCLFGRIDGNGYVNTITTNPGTTAKFSRVIHPDDHRILTVRELARCQTFPDSFVFHSEKNRVKDMYRQIGNAVPPVISRGLAIEFREALFEEWLERQE